MTQTGCPPHHWIIETAASPTSKGTCRKCGAEKDFKNSMAEISLAWRNRAAAEEGHLLRNY